ncbi:hypothetical protein LDP08_16370 [Ralstonia pseudosolanacearum]|uniref:hypothetical protein n=1 Tax=Ralstonia pseudosolanacearum TaxID=1310165 RepID=UPI003CF172EC
MNGSLASPTDPRQVERPLTEAHWMARGRAVILTLTLIGINVTGGLFLWRVVRCRPAQLELAIILSAMVTVMIGAPLIAFLCLGWYTRYREFQNSLKGDALSAYLQRYWSKRLMQVLQYNAALQDSPESMPAGDRWRKVADERFDLCDRLFARIYHEQYGLAPFVPPFVILLTVAYAAASLVGCNYNPAQCDVAALKTCVYGISQQVLVGSCGGALMFVVSDAVLSIRRRSLNVSDVYWYALRILLAIPIALAVNGQDGTDGAHALAVFALGAFPVDALLKIVRRLGFPQFTEIEKKENAPDRLLSLSGVTLPIVSVLEAEGIHSVEQVAAADPVLLSIRTGFPFRFTLRLCSQAIVRRHFGSNASVLLPIGLADVVPIDLLMKATDGIASDNLPKIENPNAVIAEAAGRLFPETDPGQREAVARMKFRQIAAEAYTVMLTRITPLDPAL